MNITLSEFRNYLAGDACSSGLNKAGIFRNKEAQMPLPANLEAKTKLEKILIKEEEDSYIVYVLENN